MLANAAKYLLSIADIDSKFFEVTGFSGEDSICSPYWFDIEFCMSGAAKAVPPLDANILDKACRLDIERNGETISYCGIVVEFSICDSDSTSYAIRLAPRLHRLSLNSSSRVFQNLTVPEIIESVVKEAELKEYFKFELEPDIVKYPKREFCVQYQETDLAFISRLMEESGIWYYFEQVRQPTGALNECAIITDIFPQFPILNRPVPFKSGSGLAEITKTGDVVESINHISAKTALMPKMVRVRAYNHQYPEGTPDGFGDVPDGRSGHVYEYGGLVKNSREAEHRATLYGRRLWVESSNADGKSNCASFRAGLRVPITHSNRSISGEYLLVSIKHVGGWDKGAYTYRNEFSCIRAEKGIYAPPLRTPIPRIDGVTTALVGATGDLAPTLNEYGHYNVNMPFVLEEKQNRVGDYGGSKDIRLAQPSSGMSDGKTYGFHFPAKRGAEMVLAYVDGNPDRPLGLGFVPNAASPSVIRNTNLAENVMRTWGGNELVMDDTHNNKNVKMSTPGERYLELHDGEKLVRIKSADSEQVFNDVEKHAKINLGKHTIHINYKNIEGDITIKTAKGNVIEMDDPKDLITVQNASEEGGSKVNKVALNGNDKSIILDSMDNTMVLNGKDKRITLESNDNKLIVDGSNNSATLDAKTNIIIKAGGKLVVDAKKDITLKAGGKIVIDAKGGVVNESPTVDITNSGQTNAKINSVVSERKAADVAVVAGINSRNENDISENELGGNIAQDNILRNEESLFHYIPIKTKDQCCLDSNLSFCESLAIAYARILENHNEKIFLRGNTFLVKIAKAVFEQNGNLFADACRKYKDENYFRECAKAIEEWNFFVDDGEGCNEKSWLSLYEVVLLLTEEYLATKCVLPKIEASECDENNDETIKAEIIVAPQSAKVEDIKEAILASLEDNREDSSDKIKVGKLFYGFLKANFPQNKLACFESLSHPEFKIEAMEAICLGSYENKIISINQRLVLDAFREENHDVRFVLLLVMLIEYGRFLNDMTNKSDSNSNDKDGKTFMSEFMEYSEGKLLKENHFEFADFIAPDSNGKERIFTIETSNLSYKRKLDIFYFLKLEQI